MTPFEMTFLVIYLVGLVIGLIIGIYQTTMMNQEKYWYHEHFMFLVGLIIWPIAGFFTYFNQMHKCWITHKDDI